MTPGERPPTAPPPEMPEASSEIGPAYRWYHKFGAVLFATFCLEIGFFLLVFPWTGWADDFAAFKPEWRRYWANLYVRGAISGLGIVNLYISFMEIFRLRRFAKR
jgi:hypothetical protein